MKALLTILVTLFIFNSCQSDKTDQPKNEEALIISGTWMRPGTINRNSAAFLKIINNTNLDDTLFAVNSDFAKVTEIHETYKVENDMMGMRRVDYIIIPSKSSIELKPGSFHIMLIGLNNNLQQGDSGEIILSFKNAGDIKINTEVK